MTVSVSRVKDTDNVMLRITYGPVEAQVTENYQHLRSVHGYLGNLLDSIDSEKESA